MTHYPDQLYAGIDAGAVSLNCVVINRDRNIIYEFPYQRHLGKVQKALQKTIKALYLKFGKNQFHSVSFTGTHGITLGKKLDAYYEFETISQVLGAVHVAPDVRTIISMGGQDTALLQLKHYPPTDKSRNMGWELEYFNTNGPCASGTGSFIDQQAQRLATSLYQKESDISLDRIDTILTDFIQLGLKSREPANVACRCTVFTKSDMIHLQNKGEKLEDIIYGLHVGNTRSYMSTIVSDRTLESPIIFIGGLSQNKLQVKAFQELFPQLIVPLHNTSLGALGVALQAMEKAEPKTLDLNVLKVESAAKEFSVPSAPKLELKLSTFEDSHKITKRIINEKACLGIDIGSTSTKYALINEHREIIHKNYVPTQGKPIEATQRLLRHLQEKVGNIVEIIGVATTGSGRNVVGDFLNADLILDEITAHAGGAIQIDPKVDTIFEIGGQDSKYIYIENAYPLDFDMNKVCAAGTGSFLHELASKHGINIVGEFQDIALSSEAPVKLAERCTVFMESDLVSYHQKGIARKDLMAGLCYAIVHNYLNRVVEKKKIGRKIMFLGGPSLNMAIVAAFENVLGRQILVPPHREVLGAYGAALRVLEKMQRTCLKKEAFPPCDTSISPQEKMQLTAMPGTTFRGLSSAIGDRMDYHEKTCHADPNCHNLCKLKVYSFDGRISIWGGECGRYELTKNRGPEKENLFSARQEIFRKYIKDVSEELTDKPCLESGGRPTIGMQSSLYGQQTAVMWAHFFDRLGYRLVLTPPTSARISRLGIASTAAETCYPIKVSHGHIKELLGKTDFLFLPTVITMPTPTDQETGFYCPLVQSNSYMARMAFDINSVNVLNPVVHMKYDTGTLALELYEQLRKKLGISQKNIRQALNHALEIQKQFHDECYTRGREIQKAHPSNEPLLIVTGRPYNLYDERLNLRLGNNLSKIGLTALPMDFIDVNRVDLSDFPSMYWGLGAGILRTARYISRRPNYFGLHLTNFSCGADSFLEHFYKKIMGSAPYLILELDEHSAVAGLMTRIEAFKNVIDNSMQEMMDKSVTHELKLAN